MYTNPPRVDIFRQIMILPMRLSLADDAVPLGLGRPGRGMEAVYYRLKNDANWAELHGIAKIVPSDLRKSDRKEIPENIAYSQSLYFHPFIRKFLAGEELKTFQHTGQKGWKVLRTIASYGEAVGSTDHESHSHYAVDLTIDRCELALAIEAGIVIFMIEVSAATHTLVRRLNEPSPVMASVNGFRPQIWGPLTSTFTLAEAVSLHNCLRRLYPPYFTGEDADGKPKYHDYHFPTSVEIDPESALEEIFELPPQTDFKRARDNFVRASGEEHQSEPMANWWAQLLRPILSLKSCVHPIAPMLCQVVDERMPTLVFVASRDANVIGFAERVRLCFADPPGRELPYSEAFLANFAKENCYERFAHYGTHYLGSNYSFVCLTGITPGNDNDYAFELQSHLRGVYFRMFFLVHLEKAALLMLSNWMAANRNSKNYLPTIERVRKQFVDFTHTLWFSNISNQEQARELYSMMQRLVGNPELFEEVKAESEQARAETELQYARVSSDNSFVLNILATLFTILGLPISIWSPLTEMGWVSKSDSAFLLSVMAWASILSLIVVLILHQRQIGPLSSWFARWMSIAVMLFLSASAASMLLLRYAFDTDDARIHFLLGLFGA